MTNMLLRKARTFKSRLDSARRLRRVCRLAADDETSLLPSPEVALAEPNGLVAIGGRVTARRLEEGYRRGIFPYYVAGEPSHWWSPDPRSVLLPSALHVPTNLRGRLRRGDFALSFDGAFREVVTACAGPRRNARDTWLTPEVIDVYCELFERGLAHSVEVRRDGHLVAGLFGVAIGQAYFGESMFTRVNDASKIGFVYLVRQLDRWGYQLIDNQFQTSYLARYGSQAVPRSEYLRRLRLALGRPGRSLPWTFERFDPLQPVS